jgi:hypothetical protein
MARVRVLRWRGIPAQVKATDESGATASRPMPPRFQQEIDRIAMREGLVETDAYLDAWEWSPEEIRDGAAADVAEAMVEELSATA